MTIAREEIFGPVLCIIAYDDEDDAVRIANDTPYGLAAYVQSKDLARARSVARQLRAGNVQINYPAVDRGAPVRGLQAIGQRTRVGRVRRQRIPGDQGHPGLRRLPDTV